MAIETNELIDVKTLSPFKRFIMTIGNLPTSYLESMTYGEMLMWFCNYLQETVIPTVNNNAEAVEELQGLFNELKSYVDDYFENLDVQEEINKKLDEMAQDGTLTNLIKGYIDPFIEIQDNKIHDLEVLVNNVVDQTPAVVSSVDDMTDTSKIYVNTTDGKWYYYDGDSWEIGGTYQSTGISEGSIDIMMFDSTLQDVYIKEFSSILEHTLVTGSYCYVSSGDFATSTSTNYDYYYIDLIKDDIYMFNVSNYQSTCGLLIVDTSDDNAIIYNSRTGTPATNPEYKSVLIKANKGNLRAYVTYNKQTNTPANMSIARKLNKLNTTATYDTTISSLKSISGYCVRGRVTQNDITFITTDFSTAYIYPMEKGKIYNIEGYNWYNEKTALVDNTMNVLANSDNDTQATTPTKFKMKFTATNDGFILANNFTYGGVTYNTTITIETLINKNVRDNLNKNTNNKKWCAMGDSLTATSTLSPNYNYTNFVSENTGLILTNSGVAGTGYLRTENNFMTVSSTVPTDSDIITIFGSFNDLNDVNSSTLGSLGDTGTTTLYGAIYTTIQNIRTRCPFAKIGIIAPTVWQSTYYYNMNDINKYWVNKYLTALEESADALGIPYLNLYKESNLQPWIEDFRSEYYKASNDGVHPNTAGHEKFIVPLIESFIRNKLS